MAGVLLKDGDGVIARAAIHDHDLIRPPRLRDEAVHQPADGLSLIQHGADHSHAHRTIIPLGRRNKETGIGNWSGSTGML